MRGDSLLDRVTESLPYALLNNTDLAQCDKWPEPVGLQGVTIMYKGIDALVKVLLQSSIVSYIGIAGRTLYNHLDHEEIDFAP